MQNKNQEGNGYVIPGGRISPDGRSAEKRAIADIIHGGIGDTRESDQPKIRGIGSAIARIADENPIEALRVAGEVVAKAQRTNDIAAKAGKIQSANALQMESIRTHLDQHPVTTNVFSISLPDAEPKSIFGKIGRKIVQFGSGAASVVGRTALASVNGTPKSALDEIRVDGNGILASAPFHAVTSRRITQQNIGDHDIAVNPPRYLDGIIGVIQGLPGISAAQVEKFIPLGQIEIKDRRSAQAIAEPVTFFPGRVKQRLLSAFGGLMSPPQATADFVPEPTEADLLRPAAKKLLQKQIDLLLSRGDERTKAEERRLVYLQSQMKHFG